MINLLGNCTLVWEGGMCVVLGHKGYTLSSAAVHRGVHLNLEQQTLTRRQELQSQQRLFVDWKRRSSPNVHLLLS